jgi:malonate-semialdehyde dehydrogenase (acetylating)/methylmalonate-semialdehyde dehydrogenase
MADAPVLENFVDGAWCSAEGTEALDLPDPSTGGLLARVPLSNAHDVDRAVRAARRAYPAWRETPVATRARLIARFRDLLETHEIELARVVVQENGKTLDEALGSVRRGIEAAEHATSGPVLLQGSFLEDVTPGVDTEMVRQPVGVAVGITPFNFPVMIPCWMAPLALVCGNTFVLKPSERVPLSAVRLATWMREAGVPPGVFNLVHGGRDAVAALLAHPEVDAVSFVGSAATARYVYTTAAAQGKRVQALAGAKNHVIVMPDADLDRAVPAILSSAFGSAGERCLAGSVVVAVEPVADTLVPRLAQAVRALKLGPGQEAGTDVGPVIRSDHRARVLEWIERGRAEGAQLVAQGEIPAEAGGYFVAPALFDHVTPRMTIAQEEIFGPVLAVVRAPDLTQAIRIANGSRFGNASVIFTKDGRSAREFRYRIEAGMLGVNIGVPAPAAYFPFVGWKGSFFGDLHANGRDAVEFYTRKKVITTRWS